MYYIVAPLVLSLVIAVLLGKILIPFLKSKKLGQKILDIGPRWHKSKEGTPVMGGLLFIFGSLASVVIFGLTLENQSGGIAVVYTYALALCCGIIGFFDDYAKLIKKQNEGLTVVQKFALQFPPPIIYVVLMRYSGIINSELYIPFVNANIELGVFYYIFIVFGIVYIMNSVNLTDGIDGLCGTVTAIITVMFIVIFYIDGNSPGLVISGACLGGIIGFLYFNIYPAKVFMGDTGSLFLGGIVSGIAVWLNMELLLLLFGIVYIIESLSVMIQVTGFKLTGKRVFKMSPIHHSFEMSGWSEFKIVSVAASLTLFMCAVSVIAAVSR
ncbi:MAG: phospho-N-acetylmuramoyl-pentapeptide-transferase [Oscillospiraceae bacterium]|nr:phospho-N-acetylmuramoyl-pentapeptide-transferase [Oscillospiraceae bacterium]